MESALSEHQLEEYNKLANVLIVDKNTKAFALRLYLQYKKLVPAIPPEKVSALLRCAIFLSEKSQTLVTVQGVRVKGIGLSLNSILRSSTSFQDFIFVLKDFTKRVHVGDREVEEGIAEFIRKFCFVLSFHKKFEQTIRKLELRARDQGENPQYMRTFVSLAWLLFADSRNKILRTSQEVVDNMFLLYSVLYTAMSLAIEHIQPCDMFDCSSAERMVRFVKALNITDTENFLAMHQLFQDYLRSLRAADTFRSSIGKTDFFSPSQITNNYKRLDQHFSKGLEVDDLDERLFLKERASTLTPSKLTPFARQGNISKKRELPHKMLCQRVIGFEEEGAAMLQNANPNLDREDKFQRAAEKQKSERTQLFPKHVVFSPSTGKTPFIGTPMTVCMDMYNWLNNKLQEQHPDNECFDMARKAALMIVQYERREEVDSVKERKTEEKRVALIFALYRSLAATLDSPETAKKQVQLGLLQISAEITYFILNVVTCKFNDLSQILDVPAYQLWQACDAVLQAGDSIPTPVRIHLLDLQVNIVCQDVWRADSSLLQFLRSGEGRRDELSSHERVFKRVLHHVVYEIYQLSTALNLDDRTAELILTTVKYVLTSQTQLLVNRHVDQILLCSIYAVCKKAKLQKKFNDIRAKYEQLNPNNRSLHTDIICNVYVSDSARTDIIKFYNQIYQPVLKGFIKGLFREPSARPVPGSPFRPSPLPHSLLNSPLKALLPKKAASLRKGNSHMLLAYNESPLINKLAKAHKVQNRKLLSFDEQEGSIAQTEKLVERREQVTNFINMKCSVMTSRPQEEGMTSLSIMHCRYTLDRVCW